VSLIFFLFQCRHSLPKPSKKLYVSFCNQLCVARLSTTCDIVCCRIVTYRTYIKPMSKKIKSSNSSTI
jgi:hypothetical protein